MIEIRGFFTDFKDFVLKRNAIDMALGIVIAVSFGKVVTSLVGDILMPFIGLLIADVNFSNLKIILKKAILDSNGKVVEPAVTINYGAFIQVLVDFLIIAFVAFVVIRLINNYIRKNDNSVEWTEYIKK